MNNNFKLHGYILRSQPSRSAAGGLAIYTRHTLTNFRRTDPSTTDDEMETIWVEIVNIKAKNILCCCAYRHSSFSPVRFKEHLELTLSLLVKISPSSLWVILILTC